MLCQAGSGSILAKGSMLFSVIMSFYAGHFHSWCCIFNDINHKRRWLPIVEDQKHWKPVELLSSDGLFSVSTDCCLIQGVPFFVPANKYLSVAFPAYKSADLYVLLRQTCPFKFGFAVCPKYGFQTARLHSCCSLRWERPCKRSHAVRDLPPKCLFKARWSKWKGHQRVLDKLAFVQYRGTVY